MGGGRGADSPHASRSARAALTCLAGAEGRCLAASRRPPRRRSTRATVARSSPRGGAAPAATPAARRAPLRLRKSEPRAEVELAGQKLACGARGAGEMRQPAEGAAAARPRQASPTTRSALAERPGGARAAEMGALAPTGATGSLRARRPRSPRSLGAMETRSRLSGPGPSGALKETVPLPRRLDCCRAALRPAPSSSSPARAARRRRGARQDAGGAVKTRFRGVCSSSRLTPLPT